MLAVRQMKVRQNQRRRRKRPRWEISCLTPPATQHCPPPYKSKWSYHNHLYQPHYSLHVSPHTQYPASVTSPAIYRSHIPTAHPSLHLPQYHLPHLYTLPKPTTTALLHLTNTCSTIMHGDGPKLLPRVTKGKGKGKAIKIQSKTTPYLSFWHYLRGLESHFVLIPDMYTTCGMAG